MRKARERNQTAKSGRIAVVRSLSLSAQTGHINLGPLIFRCALGRSGRRARKCEGDDATPIGDVIIRRIVYRPDQALRPRSHLPTSPMRRHDGWCDAPGDRNYNRPIKHPYPASAEKLWRHDTLYDIVVVLGYNDQPRHRNRGSAIFMHIAREGLKPTEGCIAMHASDLKRLIAVLRPNSKLRVLGA